MVLGRRLELVLQVVQLGLRLELVLLGLVLGYFADP